MSRPDLNNGFTPDLFKKALPDGFDPTEVANFFNSTLPQKAVDVLSAALPDFAANPPGKARAPIDLPETDDYDFEGAGAKPDWKDTGSTGGGSGGKKGGGKNKNETTTDPEPTDPTTGGTTDPEPTDPTTGTNPDPEPTSPTVDYVSGMDTPDGYNISMEFVGDWTDSLMQQVRNAAELISDLVTGDLADINGIDDLHLTVSLTSIDGGGGYFGWGGYTSVRSDTGLASEGYLRLDTADIGTMQQYNVVDDFAFHEILHAMGFGTAWNALGLVTDYNGDLRFNGANATEAYNSVYASIAGSDALSAYGVPVETDGGAGTAGLHWDHDTFGSEMMTGTLGTTNTVSDMTVAALEDMGYQTVYGDEIVLI